ncbi:HAMP domain-containing histidine kinase [Yinghuangia sp. ASG 101]|uniref:sensor histidine kinase n=1 Tax=Yinghuangia sp. ASG 101 TaxID=2896848 RepID=UPI001E3905D0|nr:HAMP domain-containing sensor histidine kinase [Yinghuangia sp. ASG 101]UGQ13860.1 HAMP domain-containing histidine kinase [Yinghuangia sp. ASG 101]
MAENNDSAEHNDSTENNGLDDRGRRGASGATEASRAARPLARAGGPGPSPRRPAHPPRPARPPAAGASEGGSHRAGEAPPRPEAPPAPNRAPSARRIILGTDPGVPYTSRLSYAPDWLRPSIRMRLTALYGGMFLIAGVLLLGSVYLLVGRNLANQQPLDFRFAPNVHILDGRGVEITPEELTRIQERWQSDQRGLVLHELLQQSLLALVLLALIAFGFGYLMAGRVLSPLGRITAAARSVAGTGGSGLHRRIDLDGPDDELKELADTFDEMLEQLDRAFDSQRKFVANASHELRTPLAINRTLLEVALGDPEMPPQLRELADNLLATNERSERLIEGLLLLARSEHELTDRKPVDLAEVAGRTFEQTAAEAAERGVELRGDFQPATASGNAVLLERVALNLAQNAVRYNVPDGWVEMATSTVDGTALLTVANSGPVIPADGVETLFEPFRRMRGDRTASEKGVGLGLSIVRSVVRAHGGWIEAEPRAEGGLIMRIGFPA